MNVPVALGGCRVRHPNPLVGPCFHVGAHTDHNGWYRLPGTTAVYLMVWRSPKDGGFEYGRCDHSLPMGSIDPHAGKRCLLPPGHKGNPHLYSMNRTIDPPTFQTGDRVTLVRAAWSLVVERMIGIDETSIVWSLTALNVFLDGQSQPVQVARGGSPEVIPAFRNGVVGYVPQLKPGEVKPLIVRHDTGHELEWLPEFLLHEMAEEPVCDRWEDDDRDYAVRLREGREVR